MSVLLRARLDRPGVRAMLAELSLLGIDPRLVHSGRGDLLTLADRDRAWLAAHSAWRGDAQAAHEVAELWNGPEPAPGVLPVATGRRVVLAPVAAPEDAIMVLLDWVDAAPSAIDATLVVLAEAPGLDLAQAMVSAVDDPDGLPDVVVVERPAPELAAAVADATVVVAAPGSAADLAAGALGRVVVEPGTGLSARLARVLETVAAPPTAAAVAAYLAQRIGRERRRRIRRPPASSRPLVAIEGGVTGVTSLAQLNRDLARALIARGDLDVAVCETGRGPLADDPEVRALLDRAVELDRPPDLLVLNDHPPAFVRPPAGRVATFLHWEFGPPPREWMHAAQLAADEVWVDSRSVREDFVAAGMPAERVVVVPLGVDTTRFGDHVAPADLRDRAPGFRFLFVGGLVHRKGVDLLLEAYRRAFTRDDDVTLVLKRFGAGGPYPANDLDTLAEAMAADPGGPRVALLDGPVDEAGMAALYRGCHCLVHPYRGEAFGMTMIEAMASGLPVIAPDRGAAREYMHDATAVLLPAARRVLPTLADGEGRLLAGPPVVHEVDIDQLAAAMRRVAADRRGAAAIGARAAAAVRADRGWDRAAAVVAARVDPVRMEIAA